MKQVFRKLWINAEPYFYHSKFSDSAVCILVFGSSTDAKQVNLTFLWAKNTCILVRGNISFSWAHKL